MSATEEALRKSLPPLEQSSPMAQGVEAEGLLAQATKQVSFYVTKLAEQVPALMRSGHDSKRRALLKAIDLLTSEFPPTQSGEEVSQPVRAAATGAGVNPGAMMLQGAGAGPQMAQDLGSAPPMPGSPG